MTRQTPAPLEDMRLSATYRPISDLVHGVQRGDYTLDLPYQRGAVWTPDQRVELIHSLMTGTPIPAIIVNERPWTAGGAVYAVIDGKQRMETLIAWYEDRLAVPASWFPAEQVARPQDTSDGPYVTSGGLTDVGRRMCERRWAIPVAAARVATVQQEAEIYLRVNGAGTAQTDADMAHAADIARGAR